MPRPLNLQRRDLAGSSTTSRGCLLMYPATKKGKQRVAMGDSSGHVEVFSIGKRLERVPAFSTVDPNDPTQTKPPVSCATLFSDQLFILRGSVLDAYSRKGRHFFSVDTNATEKLHSIAIFTPFIFVAGDFMMTTMKEMKEVGFYMAPDRILSMVVFPCWRTLQQQPSDRGVSDYLCFIGCNDRTIRLLIHNKLEAEVGCEAAVTALFFQAERYRLIYGTQAGSIGIFNVHEQGVLKRTCTHMMGHSGGGATSPTSPHSHPSPITCLTTFDVNADKKEEIVAGYEDGSLRIFSEVVGDGGPGAEVHLELLFYINVQERIMSVVGGVVCQGPEQPELLIHLFSGQLISFWLAEQEGAGAGAGAGAAPSIVAMEGAATLRVAGGVEPSQPSQRELLAAQREDAERDIHQLKDAITQQAAELARLTGAAQKQCPVVAVASTFTAQVSLHALAGRAMLSLTIDSDVALEYAVIRSAVALDAHGTESTTISTQPMEAVSSSTTKALILARPIQESGATGGRRMEVYLRAVEGCPDTISITLYALPAPRTAQVKTVRLTALPLYARVASIDPYLSATDSAHALSRLIARSEVALSSVEVHQWLIPLVPGIPDVALPAAKYAFASEFLGTVLLIEVMEKEIIFTSDSITALLAVRRQLQQVAADSRALHLDEDIRAASAASQLSKLEPAIQRCSAAKVSVELLQGLQELQGGEMDPTCLPERLSGLLVAPEAVMAEYERQKPQEEFVVRCVLDLYQSLVAFRRHAPMLNPSLQRDLEAACAGGRATSFARLTELFFPNREDLLEREQPPSSAAAPAAAPAANVVDELHSPMSDGGAGVGVARVMDGEPLPPSLQEGPAATTAV